MAEIINFNDGKGNQSLPDKKSDGKLAEYVWTCGDCGNSTFQLVIGGAIRCAHCNKYSEVRSHFRPDGKPEGE